VIRERLLFLNFYVCVLCVLCGIFFYEITNFSQFNLLKRS
jgi:hypothetical protein